jgi:hypothetical protein
MTVKHSSHFWNSGNPIWGYKENLGSNKGWISKNIGLKNVLQASSLFLSSDDKASICDGNLARFILTSHYFHKQ